MTIRTYALLTCVAATLLCLAPCHPALAEEASAKEDLRKRASALEDRIDEHKKEDNFGGLKGDLSAAVKLHADAGDKKSIRRKALKMISDILGVDNDDVKKQALEALGNTGDEDGARYIKYYLRQPDEKQADALLLAAIEAAGKVPDRALVRPLLKIFEDSKHYGAAAKAMQALGNYRSLKRQRLKIFETIVKSVQRSKPGVKGVMKGHVEGDQYRHSGEESRNRYKALALPMTKVLSKLTGNEVYGASPEDWFTMYDDNKRNLSSLFIDQ